MSRTLISTSVKSPKSFSSASAASSAFWACCSKRVKNSLFLGISDRRTARPSFGRPPAYAARRRPIGHICRPAEHVRALPPRPNAPAPGGSPDRTRQSALGALHRTLTARAGPSGGSCHVEPTSERYGTAFAQVPRARARRGGGETRGTMLLFAIGLMAGVAVGMIIVGFLAIGAYDRGYTEALERRKAWRTELVARTGIGTRALSASRKAS